MAECYFVTGTDTGVGKTLVAAAMLLAAAAEGLSTVGLKPIASGSEDGADGLSNGDARMLASAMTLRPAYSVINPVVLRPPIAPHLALREAGISLDVRGLLELCRPALQLGGEFMVVEGAGGWRVPLNDTQTLADLAKGFGFPVVLVVGLRLGCINHALLSAEAIRGDGLRLAGWVANQVDPHQTHSSENIGTLQARLNAPCIGRLPYMDGIDAARAVACLDLAALRRVWPADGHFEDSVET